VGGRAGIHAQTTGRWYREGTLPVPVRKAGRLVLVCPQNATQAARKSEGAGLYARVSYGLRAKVRWLLLGPAATVVVAGYRDRLGRVDTALAGAVLSARKRRLVVPGDSEVTGDLWVAWQRRGPRCALGCMDAG
jgi:predicted site-specific integrase-resolvase